MPLPRTYLAADKGFPAIPAWPCGTQSLAFAVLIICKENNPGCLRPARSEISEVKCHYWVSLLCGCKVVPATTQQPSYLQIDEEDNLIPSLEMSDFMGE